MIGCHTVCIKPEIVNIVTCTKYYKHANQLINE